MQQQQCAREEEAEGEAWGCGWGSREWSGAGARGETPSSGSTNTQSSSRGASRPGTPSSAQRSRRSGGPVTSSSADSSSSSSPMIIRPGHALRSAPIMARWAARSASVKAERTSAWSFIATESSPPASRRDCTAEISAQPRDAASTQVDRTSARLTVVLVSLARLMPLAAIPYAQASLSRSATRIQRRSRGPNLLRVKTR